jgi:large subunit ribosomal protein L25
MEATLEAVKRDGRGKNEANRLRAAGRIPAVLYGAKKEGKTPEGVAVAVDPKALLRILHSDSGANTLISLKVEGAESRVMVKEYQLDPVTHSLLHADFYALAMDKAMVVRVPIVLKGEARGVKLQGGMVDFLTRELQVQCLPADIPGHIDVDVTEMNLHDSIRVRDIVVEGSKWQPVTDADTMIVHLVMPKAEESATAAAAEAGPAAAAEPEVIKKGKTDEDEKADKKDKK